MGVGEMRISSVFLVGFCLWQLCCGIGLQRKLLVNEWQPLEAFSNQYNNEMNFGSRDQENEVSSQNYLQSERQTSLGKNHESKGSKSMESLEKMKGYIDELEYEKHEVALISILLGFFLCGVILMIFNFCDCVYCRWNGCVLKGRRW